MTAKTIEILYKTDKNGRTKAYRFSRSQMRYFPMNRQAADAAILAGCAIIIDPATALLTR